MRSVMRNDGCRMMNGSASATARRVPARHSSLLAPRSTRSLRRGISLLEVLFAIGILSVGILSMAALLPLGWYELNETNKLDQASTLGRAAFRDLEIRGYLRPETWVDTQAGMLIDPISGVRLLTFPYMPDLPSSGGKSCGESYYTPCQTASSTPANANKLPDKPTQPQLYPQTFNYSYSSGSPTPPIGVPVTSLGSFPPFPPSSAAGSMVLVIDPLMISNVGRATLTSVVSGTATVPDPTLPPPNQWTNIQTFPFQQTYAAGAPLIPRLTVLPTWPVSLPAAAQGLIWPNIWTSVNLPRFMPYALADRLFRSSDDLIFNADTSALRDRPAAASGSGANYQGAYSWFFTVAPAGAQIDSPAVGVNDPVTNPNLKAAATTRQFAVSVVVCQNRELDLPTALNPKPAPGEWMVPAKITGGGLSGGEVALFVDTTSGTTITNTAAWLAALKPGNWIMLSGIALGSEIRQDISGSGFNYWPRFKTIANWYRVVAVDDRSWLDPVTNTLNPLQRSVTLHGPDWPVGIQWDDIPPNSPPVQFASLAPTDGPQFVNLSTVNGPSGQVQIYAYATVVEGVIGVYQKTITIDGDSPWALP